MSQLSPKVTSLDKLPVLILIGIVEALCPHCTPQGASYEDGPRVCALAALARCSWTLNNVATSTLYHQPLPYPPLSLIRTLSQKPELCRHVKNLYCDDDPGDILDELTDDNKTTLLQLAAKYNSASAFPSPWDDGTETTLTELLEEETAVFLDGLLIAMCPNIEDLFVSLGYGARFPFSLPGTLPRLKHLHIAHADTELGTDVHRARDLIAAAPNLESFWGFMVSRVSDALTMPFANLRELRFMYSCFCRATLRAVLRSCPKLESFAYEAGGAVAGDDQFSPRSAQIELIRYAPNLQYLELVMCNGEGLWAWESDNDYDDGGGGDGGFDIDERKRFGKSGLSSMSSLQFLKIDAYCLRSGWKSEEPESLIAMLPSSVREVTVVCRQDEEGLESFPQVLLKLAEAATSLFPHLQVITFEGWKMKNDLKQKTWNSDKERQAFRDKTGVDVRHVRR